jgi:hypothetical protein
MRHKKPNCDAIAEDTLSDRIVPIADSESVTHPLIDLTRQNVCEAPHFTPEVCKPFHIWG